MPPVSRPVFYPDVNGVRTSWASIQLGINLIPVRGIKSINYKDNGEIQKIRGTGGIPLGRGRGSNDPDGDIEFYQQEWDRMLPILSAGIFGYSEQAWPLTVAYAELRDLGNAQTDILVGVRFYGAEKSNSEGNEMCTVKCKMSIMRLLWGGVHEALRY